MNDQATSNTDLKHLNTGPMILNCKQSVNETHQPNDQFENARIDDSQSKLINKNTRS